MNKINRLFLIVLAGSLSLWVSGCCTDCEKPFLGEFPLDNEEAKWMEFTEDFSRQFRSNKGEELTFYYSTPQSGFEDLIENCEETTCGFCCNEFRNGFLYSQLLSSNQAYKFDITLRKDFINYSAFDAPDSINAALSITFNERLTCSILDIPNVTLTENLKIGNRDFVKVFTCEFPQAGGVDFPGEPLRYYFTKADGIVGFELADSPAGQVIVWNLLD